jgi:transcriptional regulator with XRE-family HTH domain
MKDVPDLTINQRVKDLRKMLKLTQKSFARILAVSQSQIASIETGERTVNSRTVRQICDSFDVNSHWLRAGGGEVFVQKRDARLTKLLSLFVNLEPRYQDFILNAIDQFYEMQEEEQKGTR